ncbi:hypothetical protein BGW42_007656 [Actinomortierella wolfii]|nr:hypothetical protein BGW42_007656 [Actinomortierella wolfii]
MQIFSVLTVASLATVAFADVWATSPTADTRWPIGGKAEITWKVKAPSKQTEVADVYIVGGDYRAYRRLATLGKNVPLSDKKLVIQSVPAVQCRDTCAIEFYVGQGADFYSHNFTIAPAAELQPNPMSTVPLPGGGSPSPVAEGHGGSGGSGSMGPTPKSQEAHAQGASVTGGAAGVSTSLAAMAVTSVMAAASIALNLL